MAWAEKTFFNVEDTSAPKHETSDQRINRILKDLPPFMKLSSRKARKTLNRYEVLKQKHIENLRNNSVFKFVMKVAGFTNERIEKFWKGSDISPFVEKYSPKNINITKEDLDILVLQAREHALSDLHQFCSVIVAIPMYRAAQKGTGEIEEDEYINIPDHSALPDYPTVTEYSHSPNSVSDQKYIFNMLDSEFLIFCKKFLLMKKKPEKAYNGKNPIQWYLLTSGQGHQYKTDEDAKTTKNDNPQYKRQVYDHTNIFDKEEKQVKSYDLSNSPNSVDIGSNAYWSWMMNTPIVHWDKSTAEFWFQRYIAKWLAEEEESSGDSFPDLIIFRNRFRTLFNNMYLDKRTGKWMRDLTGLRLTKMIRGRTDVKGATIEECEPPDQYEGEHDNYRPQHMPTEVPLDFVQPIFNERFAHWKHELVLGEYEKRSMHEADKWLQQTPWAIGKIYLQPSIFAHMQEAHIGITRKFKKFAQLRLEDWLNSEEHSYFFSKLVALCIKTSDILSGKKYGLDKAYMRINLEKKRIMYSLRKLDAPKRFKNPSTLANKTLWNDYLEARKKLTSARSERVPF